jgi:hypothetical protein
METIKFIENMEIMVFIVGIFFEKLRQSEHTFILSRTIPNAIIIRKFHNYKQIP